MEERPSEFAQMVSDHLVGLLCLIAAVLGHAGGFTNRKSTIAPLHGLVAEYIWSKLDIACDQLQASSLLEAVMALESGFHLLGSCLDSEHGIPGEWLHAWPGLSLAAWHEPCEQVGIIPV
jgi:hypothetical protein